MFGFLIFSLVLALIECENWCALIQPNGTYDGLVLYRRQDLEKNVSQYLISNKFDTEWKVNISVHNGKVTFKPIENSMDKHEDNLNLLNKFSIYVGQEANSNAKECICSVWPLPGEKSTHIECFFQYLNKNHILEKTEKKRFKNQIFINAIVLKDVPSKQFFFDNGFALVHQRDDKSNPLMFNPFTNKSADCYGVCDDPPFLQSMDDSLYRKIDAIVAVDTFHVLLLNIDGKPKICFNPEKKDITEGTCSSPEKMEPIFEECFRLQTSVDTTGDITDSDGTDIMSTSSDDTERPIQTTESKPSDEPKSGSFAIIMVIVIALILVVIVFIAFVCYRKKNKNKDQIKSTNNAVKEDESSANSPDISKSSSGVEINKITGQVTGIHSEEPDVKSESDR